MKYEKYHYVYITTNLINGKQYIGDHSTDNLNDGYLGSGSYLKRSIKKYGKQNFKCEILEFFETKQQAFDAQEKYIKLHKTLISENGYNINIKGGPGVIYLSDQEKLKISKSQKGKSKPKPNGWIPWNKGKTGVYTQETLEKFSKSKIGNKYKAGIKVSEITRKKISILNKGNIPWNKGKTDIYSQETLEKISKCKIGNKYGLNNKSNTGKKFSEEHKRKMSDSHKGKIISEATKNKMKEKHYNCSGENNGMYKKSHSEETRKKISEANKIKQTCPYCNKDFDRLNLKKWHNEKCKLKNDPLDIIDL